MLLVVKGDCRLRALLNIVQLVSTVDTRLITAYRLLGQVGLNGSCSGKTDLVHGKGFCLGISRSLHPQAIPIVLMAEISKADQHAALVYARLLDQDHRLVRRGAVFLANRA